MKTWGPVAGRRGVSGGAVAWVRRITRREVQEKLGVALAAGWQVAAYKLLLPRLVSRLRGG